MYLGFFVYWSKKFKTKVNSVKDRKFLVNRWWRTRNSAIKRFTTQITTQKKGIPHFLRPKPLLFTLYQCSLEMFNQCFCKSDKRSLPHRVCVAILVSVYKPQNSPTEIAICFLLPWKLWLSICCRQLPCLLSCLTQCMVNPAMTFQLGMTTSKGNNGCMVM